LQHNQGIADFGDTAADALRHLAYCSLTKPIDWIRVIASVDPPRSGPTGPIRVIVSSVQTNSAARSTTLYLGK
jgi:hypothetical protein